MLDPVRTDMKKMSTIYDEEDTHDHEIDSAYGSVASPGMAFYASVHQAKPSTSTPLSSHPPRSSSTSSQSHNFPHLSSRSHSHNTITSPVHSRSPSSGRIFDGSLDLDYQRQGFGYSVTITGTYPSKPDTSRPRSSGSRSERRKREDSAATPTPEQVFGLDPINDAGVVRSPNFGRNGGCVAAVSQPKTLSAYERRMAKRDQFTQSLIQPGQNPAQE